MEKRDLLIVQYLAKGFKIVEISELMTKNDSLKISESMIKKRLRVIRKQFNAATLFQLGAVLKENKII
ncbi:hypothetical protein ASG31_05380 [Chryseobacterium sp. Leaf404]|uniref:helix-turn-helix transcriptional regulator n=1 Tax=unclassified Chryseobacterium TaxID=2593645 RepID=UPI0006F503E2|nr:MULTISPECIES: hypothetical protein [unclassified Chryseobacterium]KQT18166.1 hypothetical protein ASG31_05380 [Chryseobacterium sp. Leaf404]